MASKALQGILPQRWLGNVSPVWQRWRSTDQLVGQLSGSQVCLTDTLRMETIRIEEASDDTGHPSSSSSSSSENSIQKSQSQEALLSSDVHADNSVLLNSSSGSPIPLLRLRDIASRRDEQSDSESSGQESDEESTAEEGFLSSSELEEFEEIVLTPRGINSFRGSEPRSVRQSQSQREEEHNNNNNNNNYIIVNDSSPPPLERHTSKPSLLSISSTTIELAEEVYVTYIYLPPTQSPMSVTRASVLIFILTLNFVICMCMCMCMCVYHNNRVRQNLSTNKKPENSWSHSAELSIDMDLLCLELSPT